MVNDKTASGYVIDKVVSFVALPSVAALGKHVRVTNPLNGKTTIAQVLDVGPWNEHDDAYVFGLARPAAERGEHVVYVGKPPQPVQRTEPAVVNGAGIDLGERVWADLGMAGNTEVSWEFVS